MGARVIAIANQKGGVGKSTTAVSLGAALAEHGKRVLVLDLDPQGNASTGMGIRHDAREVTVYDVVVGEAPIEEAVVPTAVPGLWAIPSTIDLAGAEIELVSQFSRELRLRKALEPLRDGTTYDYVLLDCPPSLGLLTINALAAAQELIVPIQCEYYALEGLGQLLRNVRLVQQNINPNLQLTGIVMTMFDPRTKLSEQVVDEVRKHFEDRVYDVIIPRTVRLSEAPGFGQPITLYDPKSKGAECYRQLAVEVDERPAPAELMPSIEDLPAMVAPSPDRASAPPEDARDEEALDDEVAPVPRVSQLSPSEDAPTGTAAKATGSGDPEAAAWLQDLAKEAEKVAAGPTSEQVLSDAAAKVEPELDDDAVWEGDDAAPESPADAAAAPPEPAHRPGDRRVVVIDEDIDLPISGPPATDPGEPRTAGARVGATLEDDGAPRKRWRLFRKGGE